MGARRWTVVLDGTDHEVVVRHGYFTARRRIVVDGNDVVDIRPRPLDAMRLWNTATDHPFPLGGHDVFVRIDPTIDNMTYKKFLSVDGIDVDTGKPMTLLPMSGAGGAREGRWLEGYGGLLAQPFALAAIVLGQVIYQANHQPIGLVAGFGGAAICWGSRRLLGDDVWRRVLLCSVVVIALLLMVRAL